MTEFTAPGPGITITASRFRFRGTVDKPEDLSVVARLFNTEGGDVTNFCINAGYISSTVRHGAACSVRTDRIFIGCVQDGSKTLKMALPI